MMYNYFWIRIVFVLLVVVQYYIMGLI